VLHLLDANVLIVAARDYYPLARVPEFWDWLLHHGTAGNVKVPLEIFEEVSSGNDDIAQWLTVREHETALCFDEEVDVTLVQRVTREGYAPDLLDHEVDKIGRDPFLIAYALQAANRSVVTTETSKPNRTRANRHIPDVCGQFGLPCINTFGLARSLNFSTSWRQQLAGA
jgi:hypothetical protein